MSSSSSSAECPVCLTEYDAVSCVPRVIPCGHTICEGCLVLLPRAFPGTVRCPCCNHLLNLPKHPSSLPRNIDLLRFSSDSSDSSGTPNPKPLPSSSPTTTTGFIPNPWPPQFYHYWITWLLPDNVIQITSPAPSTSPDHPQTGCILKGDQTDSIRYTKSLFAGVLPENHKVRLLKLGSTSHLNQLNSFQYHPDAKVIHYLYVMDHRQRDELILMLDTTLRLHRIGKLYGFWAHEAQDSVYMVCETFTSCLVDKMLCFQAGSKQLLSRVIMMGAEMCEIIYGLHSEGLVVGCFTGSSFGFDHFGRAFFDLGNALTTGRRVRRIISDFISDQVGIGGGDFRFREFVLEYGVFASPELLAKMIGKKGVVDLETSEFEVCYGSDVWSLACLLLWLLTGKSFAEEMYNYYSLILSHGSREGEVDWLELYVGWMKEVTALLDRRLDTEFDLLKKMLFKCLEFHPVNRPSLSELWRCIKEPIIESDIDVIVKSLRLDVTQESIKYFIVLGELCRFDKEIENCTTKDVSEGNTDGIRSVEHERNSIIDKDIGEGVSKGKMKCIDLKGHIDSITALTVGGGYLFSSSYDRIVNVWSLQDFTHVLSLKGHEHRVMAVVYVDETSLCIGGDNGGVICIWNARVPLDTEPIKKLHEHKDWRYSGIHAMAVSGTQNLYTGSGDKTIKAWGLQDYTLICVMTGHKSVVSSLAVNSGVLYSGSWDGTVRLWCTSDHSPLAVIGEDLPNISPVLALAAEHSFLFVTHEDGQVKIWQNDRLLITNKAHSGAIFAVLKKERWLFAGGWDKTISVQELSGDGAELDVSLVGYVPSESTITSLAYWQGKLFVGQADKIIKVLLAMILGGRCTIVFSEMSSKAEEYGWEKEAIESICSAPGMWSVHEE